MSICNYDPIANEYYDSRHITSRNFDAATLAFCSRFDFHILSDGIILELGAGKGCTGEYLGIENSRIIQIDISKTMLLMNPREECLQRIRCDALKLPILSSTISTVAAFLFDPYNKAELFSEVYRVLKDGGVFIGTVPHYKWGITLRRILKYDKNKSRFLKRDGQLVELDSFLMEDTQIEQVAKQAGLTIIQMHDLCLPPDIKRVSKQIMIPASELGLTTYTLPIVKLIVAEKR